MPATWSIVSTMRGTPDVIAPFVAHHLASPARAVHIYLDEADADLQAMLAPLTTGPAPTSRPRLTVTVCDDAWWARHPGRIKPYKVFDRQLWNAEAARKGSDADWIVHIDSDEFLVPTGPDAPTLSDELATELAAVPAGIDWVRIPNLERMLWDGRAQETIFDGAFRARITDPATERAAYGHDSRFLKDGFSGYVRGKTAIRRRSALKMRLHDANWPGKTGRNQAGEVPPFQTLTGVQVLHIDGWTALHWTGKLLRRLETGLGDSGHRGRQAQLAYMTAATTPAARTALFDRLQRLTPARAAVLRGAGLLVETAFDPGPALAATFPGRVFAHQAVRFDAGLIAGDPDFHRRHGLVPI